MLSNSQKCELLKTRTMQFAGRCIRLADAVEGTRLGNHIAGQLIRSSTSVAANYRAACVAQSDSSFLAKISIVLEEIDEVQFWLDLIVVEKVMSMEKLKGLILEADELKAIFFSIRKTLKTKKNH